MSNSKFSFFHDLRSNLKVLEIGWKVKKIIRGQTKHGLWGSNAKTGKYLAQGCWEQICCTISRIMCPLGPHQQIWTIFIGIVCDMGMWGPFWQGWRMGQGVGVKGCKIKLDRLGHTAYLKGNGALYKRCNCFSKICNRDNAMPIFKFCCKMAADMLGYFFVVWYIHKIQNDAHMWLGANQNAAFGDSVTSWRYRSMEGEHLGKSWKFKSFQPYRMLMNVYFKKWTGAHKGAYNKLLCGTKLVNIWENEFWHYLPRSNLPEPTP